jgi:hypothetical protein
VVDFRKRAEQGAEGLLLPGEEVLAGVSVTAAPFRVGRAGLTSGLIVGGVVGAAIGAAVDKRRDRKDSEQESVRPLPDLATRPEVEPVIPAAGGLLGVTTARVLAWSVSGMGKAKDLLHALPLDEVDAVVWQRIEAAHLAGRPASIAMWIGCGPRVLPCAAIDMSATGKAVREVIAVLTERRPGRVREFPS